MGMLKVGLDLSTCKCRLHWGIDVSAFLTDRFLLREAVDLNPFWVQPVHRNNVELWEVWTSVEISH